MPFHKLLEGKILGKNAAQKKCRSIKRSGKKLVFTNGVFDILHPGHVDYLTRARALGDFLVLGLNSDRSAKKLNKGPGRPLNDQHSRALVLAGLSCVDAIVYFDEETPHDLICALMPDILVKGKDYSVEKIAGAREVLARGGKVITVKLAKGYSTTALVKKIRGN
jgi:rfaE bifunctional protein nucleotidyltransferase chain/domain